ncbi:MAG: hypothetical protein AB7E96_05265 [Deferribacterales bacterium]
MVTEKVQEVNQRSADNKNITVTHEIQEEKEHRSKSVNETEESENKTIDQNNKRKQDEQERKKREKQKEEARKQVSDTGHIIDLEA